MELSQVQQVYSNQARKPVFSNSTIEYSGVYQEEEYTNYTPYSESGEFNLNKPPHYHHHHNPEKKSWRSTVFILCFSALWLVPIIVLLYLNLHGHIIGSSAWCPFGHCRSDEFDPVVGDLYAHMYKLDRSNHNLLGMLQFVAKALEVWYVLIATWLTYSLTIILASRRAGLQLAYLTRPNEFAEIPALFDRLLWRSLPSLRGQSPNRPGTTYRNAKWRVWAFVTFTVFLGILCNLVGPAIAVLVIPSLQWRVMPSVGNETFVTVDCNIPPVATLPAFQNICTQVELSAGNYSCAGWNSNLDEWIQTSLTAGRYGRAFSNQNALTFTHNTTGYYYSQDKSWSNVTSWAPNRQALYYLYRDYRMIYQIGQGIDRSKTDSPDLYDSYLPYNNTVQTFVWRNGPVLGARANQWVGFNNETHFDTTVNSTAVIRCYEHYNLTHTPYYQFPSDMLYTKCISLGTDWDQDFKTATFSILGEYKPSIKDFGPTVHVDIFTSSYAAFLPNGRVPQGFDPKCLVRNGVVPDGVYCDWNLFFTPSDSLLEDRASKVNTIQMSIGIAPYENYPLAVTYAVDFVASAALTNYSLDPAPATNPLNWVTMPDLTLDGGSTVPIDPSWILVAWGVDAGTEITTNTASTIALHNALGELWALYPTITPENPLDPIDFLQRHTDPVALVPIMHALSLVGYTTNATSSSGQNPVPGPQNPLLQRSAQVNVWAFGMSSRTAWLGVVVACAAGVTVIMHLFFGLIARTKFLTPTQLVIAALEYTYSNEFANIERDEFAIAKIPFRVEPVEHRASEFQIFKID